jgi:hypothetical protein
MGRKSKELTIIETKIIALSKKWMDAEMAMETFKDTKELKDRYGELGRIKANLIDAIKQRNNIVSNGGTVG